jgi:hypothetical protein
VFLSCLIGLLRRRASKSPLRASDAYQRRAQVRGSLQSVLASSGCRVLLGRWQAVSPAWSFGRWIFWAVDLKGLE